MDKNKESSPDGYLREEFRLFHIETPLDHEISFHYHDFHKIFILISGDLEYWIEEKRYELKPLDAVIIPAGTLHRPVVKPGSEYKRIIIYISNDFFVNENKGLFECFSAVQSDRSHLIRFINPNSSEISELIPRIIADEEMGNDYGAEIIKRLRVTELLVLLNRALKSNQASYTALSSSNKTVEQIRDYIDSNLTRDLNIDTIAGVLYLNRSYIMHLFKQETGTTIGNYITEKRMFLANKYIKEGHPKGEASLMAGFPSYSAFHYAYNKASVSRRIGAE
ncbi:MAG: cupin domain-containing protein [Lachnospiraceae bacterium]|nr:cupin domain-containing protein [Lachnospiraceae bacterium]